MGNLQLLEKRIVELKPKFESMVSNVNKEIKFSQESEFAIQALQKNDYLMNCATNNPQSLYNAIMNIASVGISLNPILSQAYLVPRKGNVCLDISYRGLMNLALQSSDIVGIEVNLVYEKDRYKRSNGFSKIDHSFNDFDQNRGKLVGVYCSVKIPSGEYFNEAMTMKEIDDVKSTIENINSKFSPWNNFEHQMIKKTVIRRAYKYWPIKNGGFAERIANAVEISSQLEDFNFKKDKKDKKEVQEKVETKKIDLKEDIKERQDTIDKIRKILCYCLKSIKVDKNNLMFEMQVKDLKEIPKKSLSDLKRILEILENTKKSIDS